MLKMSSFDSRGQEDFMQHFVAVQVHIIICVILIIVNCSNSVLGGMVVSQGYWMKLQTQMLRVCEISKSFVILNTHFPLMSYIEYVSVQFCIYLFF